MLYNNISILYKKFTMFFLTEIVNMKIWVLTHRLMMRTWT